MAILYLIRHAEPERKGVLLGRLDSPLSVAGRAQAEEAFRGLEVSVVYCSPLVRARQTAAFIQSERLIEMPELCEVDYGEWTGKSWAEVEEQWPERAAQKSADWLGVRAPGGESWAAVSTRAGLVWQVVRDGPSPAAVVGHQGVNAALVSLIDGRDPLEFVQQYGEAIRVEYSE